MGYSVPIRQIIRQNLDKNSQEAANQSQTMIFMAGYWGISRHIELKVTTLVWYDSGILEADIAFTKLYPKGTQRTHHGYVHPKPLGDLS